MLLAGFVMGARPLKDLIFTPRPYLIEIIRIVSMPLLVGGGLWLCGVRGVYLFLAFVVVALPSGMNIIVFPESHGQDSTENSKLVFVSTLLSIITVPVIFSLAKILSGVSA
jgi:predicted permease